MMDTENQQSINYVMEIGIQIKSELIRQDISQKELAKKICEKHPLKDDGKERKEITTVNHISRLIKGKALHLDTFNKIIDVLNIEIKLIPNVLK